MHATRNDLSLKTRKSVIALLQPLLSDTLDLQSQVRMAHWNVRGPNFIALHELFDTFSAELAGHIDSLAERIVQLGGTPEGTSRQVAKASRLKEYPKGLVDAQDI
jgi:starvation-inducible DNA-binding protein